MAEELPHQQFDREGATRNYAATRPAMLNSALQNGSRSSATSRVPSAMAAFLLASLVPGHAAWAQPGADMQTVAGVAPPTSTAMLLEPALRELRSTVLVLHVSKWKAPAPVKDEAQGNVGSIDRDLQTTLPALIAQADTKPQSVADHFAVYRNLDALYEVLLRVSGTAELAASDEEAADVAHSLLTIEAARKALAEAILSTSRAQEAALARPQPPPPPAVQPAPAPTAVVADGPAAAPAHRKPKAKPKTTQATPPQP